MKKLLLTIFLVLSALINIQAQTGTLVTITTEKAAVRFTATFTGNVLVNGITPITSGVEALFAPVGGVIILSASGTVNFTEFVCAGNDLTTLDVKACTELTKLNCSNNKLTTLDISECSELIELYCNNNQLITLDISDLTSLYLLRCHNNQLTTLNMSGCDDINDLMAHNQNISISALSGVYSNPIVYTLPNGSTENIKIDGSSVAIAANLAPANGNTLAFTTDFLEEAGNDVFSGIITLEGYVPPAPVAIVTMKTNAASITLGDFIGDDDGNVWTGTGSLTANGKPVNKTGATSNIIPEDETVILLATGDVKLTQLKCQNNQLTALDILDPVNLQLLACGNNQLTTLDVSSCSKLTYIDCSNNQLATLDVTSCPLLQKLSCSNNQLTTLDVTKNTLLQELKCNTNQLPTLDLSKCTQLQTLHCYDNQLATLDISGSAPLYYLSCNNNQLTALDLSNFPALRYLYCHSNQLSTLNLSGCTDLYIMQAHNQSIFVLASDGVYKNPIEYTLPDNSSENIKIDDIAYATDDDLPNPLSGDTVDFTTDYKTSNENSNVFSGTIIMYASVTGVILNKTEISIEIGNTETLIATVTPDNANNAIIWNSSDETIATVNASGLVTAVAQGTATITVTTVYGDFTDTCEVTVTQPVTGVAINKSEITLAVGTNETLMAIITPDNADNKEVIWNSGNESVATISTDGLVTAVAQGTAIITVTTVDGAFTDTCEVTVTQPATSVTLNKSEITLTIGATETLTATVAPANADYKEVIWSSNSETIATVNDLGLVTAIAQGTAMIIVTTVDGGFKDTCEVTVTQPVTGVTLNKSELTLAIGTTETLTAIIAPDNANNKAVIWNSNNESVAVVSSSGLVVAMAKGNATITVTTVDGGFTDTCEITITQPTTSITLNKSELTLTIGATETLTATIAPANADYKDVIWSSSDETIATVNASGLVTAKVKGTAIITVTTVDGGFTATCVITVTQPATSVTLNKPELTLAIGATETIIATVAPDNANNKAVTWSSSNETIATVNASGLVTAKVQGNAVITATTVDGGFTATCAVTVTQPATGVTLNKSEITLAVGSTEALLATVAPTNADYKEVIWSSGNENIATVNASGLITAKARGTTIITATTVDGGFTANCVVTITQPVTGVTLNKPELMLPIGTTETLIATVIPDNANNQTVTWSSSDETVATVNASGLVTAKVQGNAEIIVTTIDGGFTATCSVTVTQPVTGITLNKGATTIAVGNTETLIATITPNNADNKTITWSSSAPAIATVDVSGLVTAIAKGNAVITATTIDGGFIATCAVTVTVPVTGVMLNKSEITLDVDDTEILIATVIPDNANNKTVTWSSSAPAIATVDASGLVTAKAKGNATITVRTTYGNFTATCAVIVTQPTMGITLNKPELTLAIGATETLVATITPDNANNKEIIWSSSDENIATVDALGLVTAVAQGNAAITATTVDGGFTANCSLTVIQPVTGVTLNKQELTLDVNDTETLIATVNPTIADNKEVMWSSSDENIATVDALGLITAIAQGNAVITATTVDGGFTATCAITVTEPVIYVTGVILNKETTTLAVGSMETLTATVAPYNADNKTVIWSSSNETVAIVSSLGLVVAIAKGNTTITATTVDGGFIATCGVTVIHPVTGITLNKQELTLNINDTETLIATVNPTTADNKAVTWSSSNDAVATVDALGLVTAVSKGDAVITVTTVDGSFTATCEITVNDPNSIDDATFANIKIYPVIEGIYVIGAPQGETIHIYNASGTKARELTAQSNKTFIPLPQVGVYIVKVGTKTKKVIK
jgi:Bacterial surface proteins containing Ig-like domains